MGMKGVTNLEEIHGADRNAQPCMRRVKLTTGNEFNLETNDNIQSISNATQSSGVQGHMNVLFG